MLIINCSPRVGGNSDFIEGFVSSHLQKKNIKYKVLRLRDIDIKMPDHCYDCAVGNECKNIKDDVDSKIIPLIKEHDQWLVITPTVCGHASTLFKIFIDRLAPLYHDDRIEFFHKLSIKAIIHGQINGSWKILVDWFKDFKNWTGLKSFNYLCFVSSAKKGFKLPEKKIERFL